MLNHGEPQRNVKSAKVLWLVDRSLDKPTSSVAKLPKPLGLPYELVLLSDPVKDIGPDKAIEVQLVSNGKPLADQVVSFIPRGVELATGFDQEYERRTDAEGKASFTPKEGNLYLIVAHWLKKDEKGADFVSTKYAATLTLRVPQVCPCCE